MHIIGKNRKSANGFSLVEIMVALAIGAIIFIALIGFFSGNLIHHNQELKTARLNQQLQAAMQLMVSEIRRAGYWGNANTDIGATQNNNPFNNTTGTDIQLPSSSCILFTYDHDLNGSLSGISTVTDDERYGFRVNNQVLQTRPRGVSPFDCSGSAASWENVTDRNVVLITSLNFTLNSTTVSSGGAISLLLRSVDISMTGQLANDSTITKTITQHVRIRNDKVSP